MDEEAARAVQIEAEKYEVWPENEAALNLFIALETQWLMVAGFGFVSHQGLDYNAARSTLEMMGIKRRKWPALFGDLRVMEKAALAVLNEKG